MIKIANAPCSWGALEFDLDGEAPDYVQVLNEIADTGYAGTELGDWGFMPTEPEKLSQEIHGRKLVLLGAFVPVFLKNPASHQAGIEVAVRTARLMAAVEGSLPFIVLADENGRVPERTKNVGRVTPEMGLSDPEWLAVNTVIEESQAWEVIPRLKEANAQGIVEYPLNKVVM